MEALLARKPERTRAAGPKADDADLQSSRHENGATSGLPQFLLGGCSGRTVLASLTIGRADDPFEREADAFADTVVGGGRIAAGSGAAGNGDAEAPHVQAQCADCGEGHLCSRCAAEYHATASASIQRAPAAGAPSRLAAPVSRLPVPDSGDPIPDSIRGRLESGLGADLQHVRVHSSAPAQQAADALHAKAFTHQDHIWLGSGQRADNVGLIAHEATHVVQQGAAPILGGADPASRQAHDAPPAVQPDLLDDALDVGTGIVTGGADMVVGGAKALGGAVVEGAEAVGGAVKDTAIALVRQVSPDLADLMEQGPMAFVTGLLHKAIEDWLPSLLGGINIVEVADSLVSTFNDAFNFIAGVMKGDAKSCQAFGDMLGAIRDAAMSLMNNPVVELLKGVMSTVGETIGTIVTFVAAPMFDALAGIIGGAWAGIKKAASTVWGWLKKVKDLAASAWSAVTEALGFSGEGEDSVWGWIKSKADAIWTTIRDTFAPVVKPLKKVAMVFSMFTGLGQIYLLVKYGPKVVEAITWLWNHRNDDNIVRTAHEEMGNSILPQVLDAAQGFRDKIKEAVGWVVGTATSLSTSLLELVGAISGVPLLNLAQGLVETVSDGVKSLLEWGQGLFQQAAEWVTSAAQRIWDFIQPYKEVLSSIALAILNPPMIPVLLAGWAWVKLPRCIKVPIIDFLLDIVIGALEAMPDLAIFGPLWTLLKPGVLGFLRGIRNQSPEAKETVSNRVAKIIAGASLEFLFGFVKGFLIGVWEGITDPIKAIWMIMQGLTWVMDYLDSLSNAALGIAPAGGPGGGGAASAREPGGEQTLTNVGTIRRPAAAAVVAGAPAAASVAAPAPAAPASAAPVAAPEAAGPRPSDVDLPDFVRQQASDLAPDVGVVTANFFDALSEYFSGGEGTSFDSLSAKFGELWSSIQAKLEEIGGDLANKVTTFFTSGAEADAKLGEGVGWLAGTIIFQIVLDVITAGGWVAAGPVVKGIAKFINWPMEFMGEAFKLLGKLGGFLIDGVKSLGKMAAEAAGGALKAVVEALGSAGKKLMSMAEALIARFGGKGAGLAEREGAKLAEREAAALAEREAAQLAEKEAAKLGEKEAAELAEKKTAGAVEREGAEAAEKKTATEAEEKAAKEGEGTAAKKESDAARETAERPAAVALAEGIELSMKARGASVPALIGALDAAVMPRFTWVKGFKAENEGLAFMIYMIASKIPLLPYPAVGPSGKQWDDPHMTEDEFIKDYRDRYPKSSSDISDRELKQRFNNGKGDRLNPETGRLREPIRPIEPAKPRGDLPTEGPAVDRWNACAYGDPKTIPCFTAGTVVKTPSGDRCIEALTEGDLVYAYDFEADAVEERPVTFVHKNWTQDLVVIETDQGRIEATAGHPFWVMNDQRWTAAAHLTVGAALRSFDGGQTKVNGIDVCAAEEPTYNFEIAHRHNYFVGVAGVLVHNANVVESSFMVIDTRYVEIYRVTDASGKVVYVGQTVAGVDVRLLQHVNDPDSALFIKENSPLRRAPDFPENVYKSRRVGGGQWTPYEAAVWEQHHIDAAGGKNALLNRQDAITMEKFETYKKMHNPCR